MNWRDTILGEFISMKRGYDLPEDRRTAGRVPIIGSAGITGYHNEAKVFGGGVTIGRSGNSFGKIYYCKEDFWPHNAAMYINDTKGNDERFIYYFLKNLDFSNYNSGSAQPSLNRNFIYPIRIRVPSPAIQQKIASILSAYDDLIENNLKRIKLLEEAAQNIYKEWFVNFRINGEQLEVNKETGLPEGWQVKTVFDAAHVLSGGTPKTDVPQFWNGDIPFFTPTDASSNRFMYINKTEKWITAEGLNKCNSQLYEKDTVFITARGTVGKICLAMVPMAMNQSCYALKGKDISQKFLAFGIKGVINVIKKSAAGGVFDTIVVDTFKKIPIVIPSREYSTKFDQVVQPMLEQSAVLQKENQKLKEARDLLLPRLMNGSIEV